MERFLSGARNHTASDKNSAIGCYAVEIWAGTLPGVVPTQLDGAILEMSKKSHRKRRKPDNRVLCSGNLGGAAATIAVSVCSCWSTSPRNWMERFLSGARNHTASDKIQQSGAMQ
jgi:hypothetical protein